MSKFEFVTELPERKKGGRSPDPLLADFAQALREYPGMWAVWPRPISEATAKSIGHNIRRGRFPSLPPSEFEGSYRSGTAYVRYRVEPIGGEQ